MTERLTNPEQDEHERLASFVIPADPEAPVTSLEFGVGDLTAKQQLVGGYIEAIDLVDPAATFYINDEGKLNGLHINGRATALLWAHNPAFRNHDVIVGDAILLGPPDAEGDDTGIPDELAAVLTAGRCSVEIKAADSEVWQKLPGEFERWIDAYALALTVVGDGSLRLVEGSDNA